PVPDEEVNRLPQKYRLPFLLCYFEGKTNEEAAHQLGSPLRTVLSGLARARGRLRSRLMQRGIALSPSALTAVLADQAASAAMPAALAPATVKAALLFAAPCQPIGAAWRRQPGRGGPLGGRRAVGCVLGTLDLGYRCQRNPDTKKMKTPLYRNCP